MTRTTSTRREFCVGALRAGATAVVAGAWSPLLSSHPVGAAQRVFRHGVASGKGSVGVEFVVPGITAAPPLYDRPERQRSFRASLVAANPHLKFTDWTHHGYALIDIERERVRSEWYFVDTVLERSRNEHLGAAYEVRSGTARLLSTHTSVK